MKVELEHVLKFIDKSLKIYEKTKGDGKYTGVCSSTSTSTGPTIDIKFPVFGSLEDGELLVEYAHEVIYQTENSTIINDILLRVRDKEREIVEEKRNDKIKEFVKIVSDM